MPPQAPDSLPKYLARGLPKQDLETLEDIRDYVDELIDEARQAIEEDELPEDAEPVGEADGRGTIVKERVKCGADCTCNNGDKHGPYVYLYRRKADGTLTSKYLGKPGEVEL